MLARHESYWVLASSHSLERENAYRITNTPDCDANALGSVHASADNLGVVVGRGTRNIELGDGDFLDVRSRDGVKGGLSGISLASLKMHLGSNPINCSWVGLVDPVDERNTSVDFGVRGVQVVVVNV